MTPEERPVHLTRKLAGMLRLFRPELPLAAGVCVLAGEILALGGFPPLREGALGFLAGFLLSASALILNDVFDLDVDRVNAPGRPLPSGMVTLREAVALFVFTAAFGLICAALLGELCFGFAVLVWIIGVLYNWRFKAAGLTGNLMVAVSVAATFVLGGLAAGRPAQPLVWFFGLLAFLIDLGEEIAGDAMDAEGDALRGSRSLAITFGRRRALQISLALFATAGLAMPVPALCGWVGAPYYWMIAVAEIAILLFAVRLARSRTPAEGRAAMRGIYLGAMAGLAAFILGGG